MDPVGPHLHFASAYLQGVSSSAPPQTLYDDGDNDDDCYYGIHPKYLRNEYL